MLSLFLPVGLLLISSVLIISSISFHLFYLQLVWILLGFGVVLLFHFFDWRTLFYYRWFPFVLYGISTILLTIVVSQGVFIRNVRGWLTIGLFTFQPVELAKVALVVCYSYYFARRHLMIARFSTIVISLFILLPPFLLTLAQPDLGSGLILLGVWGSYLLMSGLPKRYVIAFLLLLAISSPLVWFYGLKSYQRARITGVFYPQEHALTYNYSTIQSRIAIGSAGWWGRGYGQGTQTQLGFLSEPANDFVLSAFTEEWGWFGGLLVVASFVALEIGVLRVGIGAARNVEKFLCLGTVALWGINFAINTGSATGLFPVIGVTYPFLSYGGSSLLINFFLLAVINGIRRFQ